MAANPLRSDIAEIFTAASFTREDGGERFDDLALQIEEVLDGLMARLSVQYGLSYKRVKIYEKQKQSLIDDLKKMKKERYGR
jgi:hypothetical protein